MLKYIERGARVMNCGELSLKELLMGSMNHRWIEPINCKWPVSFIFSEGKKVTGNDFISIKENVICNNCNKRVSVIELANTSLNIEVLLEVTLYKTFNIIQLGGKITNGGRSVLKGFRDPKIIDLCWRKSVCHLPYIRRIKGGPWGDVAYPPVGHRCEDVQLLEHYQQWNSISAVCPEDDGRASCEYQPLMTVGDDKKAGIFIALEWAGSYSIDCKRVQDFWGYNTEGDIKVSAGVTGVNIDLYPEMSIPLPNAWIAFYEGNLDSGGQLWRKFFGKILAPKLLGDRLLPLTSYNHWIAYEIELFDELKAINEARICAQLGLEYFVFDAGWYKGGFRGGNGNWEITDTEKIPSGFNTLSKTISDMGLKFGSWLEPEYAALDSKLVMEHPDWFLDYEPSKDEISNEGRGRNILMNFALKEVQDWWVEFFYKWVKECNIRWVRWDFNRPPAKFWKHNDSAGNKGLTQIHYVRGLYDTLDRILHNCPELVIEQCAGGGTRIEPGILRRGHTYWIDDHSSSPHLVRFFQHGMNLFWPARYANVNVVSRNGDISESEWLSHQAGSFGVSSRLVDWDKEKLNELKRQIERFKEFRHLLGGRFYSISGQPDYLRGVHDLNFEKGDKCLSIQHNLDTGGVEIELSEGVLQ